jgi:hypothetical protein
MSAARLAWEVQWCLQRLLLHWYHSQRLDGLWHVSVFDRRMGLEVKDSVGGDQDSAPDRRNRIPIVAQAISPTLQLLFIWLGLVWCAAAILLSPHAGLSPRAHDTL